FRTERWYAEKLPGINPLVLISMFLVLVLNLFGHATRSWCNVTLALQRFLLRTAFTNPFAGQAPRELSYRESQILQTLPADLRTVHSLFELKPRIRQYASCPSCSFLHPPDDDEGLRYPP
ncbi:hypothetical protein CONPUDRAFT_17671, partial [Coniophora puteana RWD-64-598 SS2]